MRILFFFIAAVTCQVTLEEQMECGIPQYAIKPKPRSGNRIVGGWEAQPYSLPWQVRIVIYFNDETAESYKCGGSLIQMKPGNKTDLILTAAHCFYDPDKGEWSPEKRVLVMAGFHNERDRNELVGHVYKVKRIIPEPLFSKYGIAEDIALVQTELEIPYTEKTRPICLPEPREELAAGTECFVSGWGVTSENGSSIGPLQMVDVKIQPDAACIYKDFRGVVFCAGHMEGGKDACVGDSGGPLICRVGERYAQYGIVSQGEGCARIKKPGEYTKVSMFLPWLEENVKKLGGSYAGPVKPVTRNHSSLSSPGGNVGPAKPQVSVAQPASPGRITPTAQSPAASSALKGPLPRPSALSGSHFARPISPPRPYVSPYLRL